MVSDGIPCSAKVLNGSNATVYLASDSSSSNVFFVIFTGLIYVSLPCVSTALIETIFSPSFSVNK